jgi:hypothetical protein
LRNIVSEGTFENGVREESNEEPSRTKKKKDFFPIA